MNQLKDSRLVDCVCSAAVWLLIGYRGCLSGIQWATPTHFKRRGAIYQASFDQSPRSEASGLPVFWSARTRKAAGEEFCLLDARPFFFLQQAEILRQGFKGPKCPGYLPKFIPFFGMLFHHFDWTNSLDFINLPPPPNSSPLFFFFFFFLSHPLLPPSLFLRSEVLFYRHLPAMKLGSTYRVVIALRTLFVR